MPRTIMLEGPEFEQFQEKLKTCQICGFHDVKPVWKHAWLKHGISKYDYSLQYLVHPCPCGGCGEQVMPHKDGCISFYIKRHLGPNRKWTERDELLLRCAYETWPLEFPRRLLEKYTKRQCYSKAFLEGFSRYDNRKPMVKTLTSVEAAYIAGALDSDGCISFRADNPWSTPFSVSNTDKKLPTWLLRTIGTGTVRGPYANGVGRKPVYIYALTRQADIFDLLLQIRPFVAGRRERLELTIGVLGERYGQEEAQT